MERVLDGLVEECITRYGGGRAYFDQLDENVRTPFFFEALTETVDARYGHLPPLVVTGKFGEEYRDWLKKSGREWHTILLFQGSLRYDNFVTVPGSLREGYVFLDDSFYLGRTLAAVSTGLNRHGSRILSTHVIYDGSRYRLPQAALYRYFDHYGNPTHIREGQ
jgi:hypothetical protein